jgi:hypothetical protein
MIHRMGKKERRVCEQVFFNAMLYITLGIALELAISCGCSDLRTDFRSIE